MARRGNSEGTITRRRDGRWEARLTLPGDRRRSFYGRTRKEVAQKLQRSQKAISEGLPLPQERVTLRGYLDRWLSESVQPTVRASTLQSYSSIVRVHIGPELGRIPLARLTAQDVQSFLNRKQASGLAPRTCQYLHAVLRRALGQAERWGLVARNVARLVSPPCVPRAQIHPLTPVEVKKLLTAVQGHRLAALYTVAVAIGLRQGEALGLRWEDVNLEAGTISIRASLARVDGSYVLAELKTQRSRRTIKLPDVCVTALAAHRESQALERDFVAAAWQDELSLVFTRADGAPLSRHAVTRRFQRVLADAGIPKRRFHDLRHTCATLLLAQGVPLRVVMEILGHSQMATTADIYAHVLPILMADAAERMDAVLA